MKRLEHGHIVAHADEVARHRKARGTRADDGHFLARLGRQLGKAHFTVHALMVGHKAFQPAYGHRFALDCQNAQFLALFFLRADPSADGRERVGFLQLLGGLVELAFLHQCQESGDVVVYRASLDAARLLALQAAAGLQHGHLSRIAEGDLVEIVGAVFRRLLRHRLSRCFL